MKTKLWMIAALAPLIGLLAETARADVVHLKNGRTIRGANVELDASHVRIRFPGGSIRLKRSAVERVEPAPRTRTRPPPRRVDHRLVQLSALARAIRQAYAEGDTALGERLLLSHPLARSVHSLRGAARVECSAVENAEGGLRVRARLRRAVGDHAPLLIAIPPGTRASARGCELLLLRSAVVVLDDAHPEATLLLPPARASLLVKTPSEAGPLRLSQVVDSAQAALLVLCCSGERPPSEAATQLALWTLSDEVVPEGLVSHGPRLTLGSRQLILPLHGQSAARLLEAAGLAWQRLRFFKPTPLPALPPSVPKPGESSS